MFVLKSLWITFLAIVVVVVWFVMLEDLIIRTQPSDLEPPPAPIGLVHV